MEKLSEGIKVAVAVCRSILGGKVMLVEYRGTCDGLHGRLIEMVGYDPRCLEWGEN